MSNDKMQKQFQGHSGFQPAFAGSLGDGGTPGGAVIGWEKKDFRE